MQVLTLLTLVLILVSCASGPQSPAYERDSWRPDGRLKIAVLDETRRTPKADVRLYQSTDSVPPHTAIAFITADGDTGEEGRIVSMMLDYARHRGADAVVLLGADRPNEKLAIAHPLWQSAGRRVFRANVVLQSVSR